MCGLRRAGGEAGPRLKEGKKETRIITFKRGKTWTYAIDLGWDDNGKRIRKWSGGHPTKKDATFRVIQGLIHPVYEAK